MICKPYFLYQINAFNYTQIHSDMVSYFLSNHIDSVLKELPFAFVITE